MGANLSRFEKGHIPYNKGETKYTNESVKRTSEKDKLWIRTEEQKKKMSLTRRLLIKEGKIVTPFMKNPLMRKGIRVGNWFNCGYCDNQIYRGKSDKEKHHFCNRKCFGNFRRGKKNPEHGLKIIGRPNMNPNGYGKAGFRVDLNCFFRSKYEANFARILNYLGIKWEYEKQIYRVFFNDCSYLPDFYLPELKIFIEVKGYLTLEGKRRLKLLYKYNPGFPIKIADGESYVQLKKRFEILIPNWEN